MNITENKLLILFLYNIHYTYQPKRGHLLQRILDIHRKMVLKLGRHTECVRKTVYTTLVNACIVI